MIALAKCLLSLLLFFGLGSLPGPVGAQSPAPRDLLIVLDNSGSMRKSDPAHRMRAAVLEFAERIGPEDRLALLLFDHRVRLLQGFGGLGAEAARTLREPLQRLDYRGRLTDIAGAIEHALREFRANPRAGAERVIVFLTDGIIDTGDAGRDAERARWLREELAGEAAREGVRIHSIAFTPRADADLVRSLAEMTGGSFVRAETAADLGPAFADLTARMARPSPAVADMAAVGGGQAPAGAKLEAAAAAAEAPSMAGRVPVAGGMTEGTEVVGSTPERPRADPTSGVPSATVSPPAPAPAPAATPSATAPTAGVPSATVSPPAPAATPSATAPTAGAPAATASPPATAATAAPAAPPSATAPDSGASASAAEAEGAPPAGDPSVTQLIERLNVTPDELAALLTTTQLAPADLLALVDEAGLTLEQLRGMHVGQAAATRPEEVTGAVAAVPESALARLGARIGGAPEEAQRLVDATRLPAEDLLALLDEAGLTLEELQGLAVGDAVVTRPGGDVTSIAAPDAGAARAAGEGEDTSGVTGTQTSPAGVAAMPATESEGPTAPSPSAMGQPLVGPAGAPLWVIAATLGGIVLIAVGSLLALRPRGRRGFDQASQLAVPAASLGVTATATAIAAGDADAVPVRPPEAWLSDPQRHSGRERIPLGSKPLTIGRVVGAQPDRLDYLVLNQPTIGRQHSLIEYRSTAWFIADLGSVNGTFVNGQRIGGEAQRLRSGDRIRFHRYEFGFVQPADASDADATVVAQLPGEATLIADRTLAGATGAGVAAGAGVIAGLGLSPVRGDGPGDHTAAVPTGGGMTDHELPLPGSLDTGGGLSATGDLTEPNFNPAAHHFEEEAGLDLFMASQMFAATNRPGEDLLGRDASGDAAHESTVILPGSLVSVDLPLEPVGEASEVTAGTLQPTAWPRDEESGTPAARPSTLQPRSGESQAPDAVAGDGAPGVFDEDFFGTQELQPVPPSPAASAGSTGGREPADVYFPTTPGVSAPGEGAPSRVSAPDHPPLSPEDDLFAEYPAGPFGGPVAGPVAGADPSAGLGDADDFFATTVIQPAGPAAVAKAGSAEANGVPPSDMTAEEAEGLFATVFHDAPAVTTMADVPATSERRDPSGGAADAGPSQVGEAEHTSPSATRSTLRVRADSTVLLGESAVGESSPPDAPAPGAEPTGAPAAVSGAPAAVPGGPAAAPGAARPDGATPDPASTGKEPADTGTDEFDAFFHDDDRR